MGKNKKIGPDLFLDSQVYPLRLPLLISEDEKIKSLQLFDGITKNLSEISSHVSILSPGFNPHSLHSHKEEELIILLLGNIDLIVPDATSPGATKSIPVKKGQFVYYPSYFNHTLKAAGEENAVYLMFKWHTYRRNTNPFPDYGCFDIYEQFRHLDIEENQSTKLIFEFMTGYLKRLHCHISILLPGAGYKPHSDIHDTAIVVLENEVETLGKKAKPYDVIFYQAGKLHGMHNPGPAISKYIVFEFHAPDKMLFSKIFNVIDYFFTRVKDGNRWRRKLKKIFKCLLACLRFS